MRFRSSGMETAAHGRPARTAPLCTALLLGDGRSLRIPEHLPAAPGFDNAAAEINGAAGVPILGGSAAPGCPPRGGNFLKDLTAARSFGCLSWALPLALVSLVSSRPVLCGARLPAEPLRRRALHPLGAPLLATISARRPRHALNLDFVRRLLEGDALERG